MYSRTMHTLAIDGVAFDSDSLVALDAGINDALGPFFGSTPCETSLLQEELSLTSFFEATAVFAGAGMVDLEGGCSLLVEEFLLAALGDAGGKGCLRTTETTL